MQKHTNTVRCTKSEVMLRNQDVGVRFTSPQVSYFLDIFNTIRSSFEQSLGRLFCRFKLPRSCMALHSNLHSFRKPIVLRFTWGLQIGFFPSYKKILLEQHCTETFIFSKQNEQAALVWPAKLVTKAYILYSYKIFCLILCQFI